MVSGTEIRNAAAVEGDVTGRQGARPGSIREDSVPDLDPPPPDDHGPAVGVSQHRPRKLDRGTRAEAREGGGWIRLRLGIVVVGIRTIRPMQLAGLVGSLRIVAHLLLILAVLRDVLHGRSPGWERAGNGAGVPTTRASAVPRASAGAKRRAALCGRSGLPPISGKGFGVGLAEPVAFFRGPRSRAFRFSDAVAPREEPLSRRAGRGAILRIREEPA